ncbi:MAG: glycosyltransferase, partial [Dehalococcoidia bacterium]
MADWIRRVLEQLGYRVIHVKNITDVGHMRQEMLEQGEDKVIAAAMTEGKTPQEIAQHYTESFHRDEGGVNILPAHHFPKATDHVKEMVAIVERLYQEGYAYKAGDNIYFEVSKFPSYGELSGNLGSELLAGVRAEADPLKRDPRDFTLWKAAEPGRVLKWPSPWGEGFPGWHIECSAMATKYLGSHLDIHTGGVDNIFPHHEGERAQSEGAFGGPYVGLWVHGQHLLADGVKMAKSSANDYTLADLEARGFDPLAFRYLCLTAKYRTRLNFTFTALRAAQQGLQRLRNRVWEWSRFDGAAEDSEAEGRWHQAFLERVQDDLDLPGALALTWEMIGSDLPSSIKLRLVLVFDEVLGLGLGRVPEDYKVPVPVKALTERRSLLRDQSDFSESDKLRKEIDVQGYLVEDTHNGSRVRPRSKLEKHSERWPTVSSPREVASLLAASDEVDYSINIVARDHLDDAKRCLKGALSWGENYRMEVVVVDNGSAGDASGGLEEASRRNPRVKVIHTDHVLGEAQARNIGLKQSRGKYVALLDTSVEVVGDIFAPIAKALGDDTVGVVGPWGLRSENMHHFHEEVYDGEADAMQLYLFAFRRRLLQEVGLMRESFRFYRNLDIDYGFAFKDRGYRIVTIPGLPLKRHVHREWERLSQPERDKLSRINWKRMYKKWGHRKDLLIGTNV